MSYDELKANLNQFSSPFIEERLYFQFKHGLYIADIAVFVPFYRGAVVFEYKKIRDEIKSVFVPFYRGAVVFNYGIAFYECGYNGFSSPFIEERLYLKKRI